MQILIKLYEYDLKSTSQNKDVKDLRRSDFSKLTDELFNVADEVHYTSQEDETKVLKTRNPDLISESSLGFL